MAGQEEIIKQLQNDLEEQRRSSAKLAADFSHLKQNEARYHRMISEIKDYAIIYLDKNGFIRDWNKGAEKIKQYTEEEIIGKHFSQFYLPEDQANDLPNKLIRLANENGSSLQEGWRKRKDGSKFWGSITITALHDDAGDIVGYSKVTRDLTDKKLAEDAQLQMTKQLLESLEELKVSETRYHQMIAEVRDYAIILLDVDGNIQNWNAGAQAIKGYSTEIIGKNFSVFYTKEDREAELPKQLLSIAVQTGRAIHEGWRVRKDGSKFWGSIVITALHDKDGKMLGFSKVTRDLTDKKIAGDKMLAYTIELESQNKELEQFAYVASHDLQEPLRKIRVFSELIQKDIHDEQAVSKYFEKITISAARMSELIKSILNYSQLAKGTEKIIEVDLNEIMRDIQTDYEQLIEEKNATITVKNTLPVIKGYSLQQSQLFSNLIGNALKFSRGNPSITITSRTVRKEEIINLPLHMADIEYYEISIADDGIGFEQQYEKLIFTMFQRLHAKHTYGGTGIGLALCKKIVENHNGYIAVRSEENKGSVFYVYLPAQ